MNKVPKFKVLIIWVGYIKEREREIHTINYAMLHCTNLNEVVGIEFCRKIRKRVKIQLMLILGAKKNFKEEAMLEHQ